MNDCEVEFYGMNLMVNSVNIISEISIKSAEPSNSYQEYTQMPKAAKEAAATCGSPLERGGGVCHSALVLEYIVG